MANYAKIIPFDIANAPGISVTVFLSGCDAYPKCKDVLILLLGIKTMEKNLLGTYLKKLIFF